MNIILDYLKQMQAENPSFFYAIEEQSNGNNIFWADSTFKSNYNHFGDTVTFDTSFRSNLYRVPLVFITGVNHHSQPILFGCGLLHHESESTYIWFLETWLHSMSSGNFPVSITTRPDPFIQLAVSRVLPQTRHRFCKWSVLGQTREKLSQTHPDFDVELAKIVLETETVNEFESRWKSLISRFSQNTPEDVDDNEWIRSIYNARNRWVPVYLHDTFFGELFPKIPLKSFFDGYITFTTSIESLVKVYENARTEWDNVELKSDIETGTTWVPLLKTPSPMEKQVANLYTPRAFLKFQEELVETLANQAAKIEENGSLSIYQVAKFGEKEKEKVKSHVVSFSPYEMKANCSCCMFEFSGIVCRHILTVFRSKNVLTLPARYILKRWTRDAKRGADPVSGVSADWVSGADLVSGRYNSLRNEAMKFVEQGAKSINVYNSAMDALQMAAKKVADSKKKRQFLETNREIDYQSREEKEKKIRELSDELEKTNERCQVYRSNLLAVLKDMEEQKLKLSVKVQNARLNLKE